MGKFLQFKIFCNSSEKKIFLKGITSRSSSWLSFLSFSQRICEVFDSLNVARMFSNLFFFLGRVEVDSLNYLFYFYKPFSTDFALIKEFSKLT